MTLQLKDKFKAEVENKFYYSSFASRLFVENPCRLCSYDFLGIFCLYCRLKILNCLLPRISDFSHSYTNRNSNSKTICFVTALNFFMKNSSIVTSIYKISIFPAKRCSKIQILNYVCPSLFLLFWNFCK